MNGSDGGTEPQLDFDVADVIATAVVYLACTVVLYGLGKYTGSRLCEVVVPGTLATDAPDPSTEEMRRDERGR